MRNSPAKPPQDNGVKLEPVIEHIVQARIFGTPITVLVDRIHIVPYQSEDEDSQAYRLWLSDTQKMVQAVLLAKFRPFLASRKIREGSFVQISRYRVAKANRINRKGQVLYLAVEDIRPVGHDGRRSVPLTVEQARVSTELPTTREEGISSISPILPGPELSVDLQNQGLLGQKRAYDERCPSPPSVSRDQTKKYTLPDGAGAIGSRASFSAVASSTRRTFRPPLRLSSGTEPFSNEKNKLRSITRPLSLTTLAEVTGLPHTLQRNRVIDIFAVIVEVSPTVVTRTHLSHLDVPLSRNLRIVDPSTFKKVQLTVFVDATDFKPTVGTVALFRSVTTHEWDGGSLKAYPRDCMGREWFLPWPWDVEECDVKAMLSWWQARKLAGLVS